MCANCTSHGPFTSALAPTSSTTVPCPVLGKNAASAAQEVRPEAAGPLAERERGALGHGTGAEVASHRINPDARDRGHEGRPPLCFARRNDLFALVESTARTDPVRQPRGAAVRAV